MKNKAFSIIELIISIFVIAVGLLAVFGVTQKILSETITSVFRFEAAYLAQEGFEIVRNIRDNNIITGNDWNSGFDLCNPDYSFFCEADYRDPILASHSLPQEPRTLRFGGVFYNYSEGTQINFKRVITIKPIEEGAAGVSVEVIWEEKGEEHNFLLKANLYEWK